MGILEDIQPLIEQITNTTNPDEVIFYAVGFFESEKNLEELSDEDCMQIIKKLIAINSDAQLAAELAMVIAEKKGLYSFARKIVSDKSKYTGDDWSLTKFDEKRLEVLTFTTIHDPKNCPPEIIITYDEMIESDNPVRNGWDNIDWEAPKVQFFKGYYNGEYFEVGRVYEDPYEDDNGEIYYNSYYFKLESFGGDDENALENIIESINNSSYIWSEEKENLAYIDLSGQTIINIDYLSNHTNLTELNLNGCQNLESLEGLWNLKNLKKLHWHECNWDELSDLSELTSLEYLSLSNSQGDEELGLNIDSIRDLINLKHLDLSFCETIFDFSPIKNLTKLVYLDLTDCKIEDLELSDLNNLKTLKLSGCKSLWNIQSLSKLNNLENLYLDGCSNVEDLTPIANLEKLKIIDLSDCENLSIYPENDILKGEELASFLNNINAQQ